MAFFNIGATVDFETSSLTNVQYHIDSASTKNIHAKERSARPGMLTNLINTVFLQAKKQDTTSIFSTQATLTFIGKALATYILNFNFKVNQLECLYNKHTSQDLTAFLPQKDALKIQSAAGAEQQLNSKRSDG